MPYRYLFLLSLLLLPATVLGRPLEKSRMLPKFEQLDASGRQESAKLGSPAFQAAIAGTTFYGGTFWAADSLRWEAYENQLWTFDTGVGSSMVPDGGAGDLSAPTSSWVNPYKSRGLHATMEGWIGFDVTYSEITYFRRTASTDPRFDTIKCTGSAAGLEGTYSYWCGVFPAEAGATCFAAGQGYGNGWDVCIEHSFEYPGGNATLSYRFKNETEEGFDYVYVYSDTTGNGNLVEVLSYTGTVSGVATLPLVPGAELPRVPKPIKLLFCMASDGAWSDQDGLSPTSCGAFAVDNIVLTGAISHTANFESGDDGWVLSAPHAGLGGEWSNLYSLNDLPPPLSACPCALTDSVLAFPDDGGGHNNYQDNLAASPWIDLKAYGKVGAPGKIIRTNLYTNLPLLNYIFMQFEAQWYPEKCLQTGKLVTSPWTSNGFVYYFGGIPTCTSTRPGTIGTQLDLSGFIPPGAEQIRIALGVLSYCRYFASCTQVSNSTPWIDLAGLGVYGEPNAPFISTTGNDRAQDCFPSDGTLYLGSTGRVDCNNVQGDSQPEWRTTLGDTLVVRGLAQNAEVYVHFRVRPGPGTSIGGFNSWYQSHAISPIDPTFRLARCDTAEFGGSGPIFGSWMTSYHEADPNFAAHGVNDRTIDTHDITPWGAAWRLSHDIFPDRLLTTGSRVEYFFSSNLVGSTTSLLDPQNAPTVPYEMEVLPSSFTADNTFNCVLYVDHANEEAQPVIESSLATILGFGSENAEDTRWDRYDVNAPSSGQASLGRPTGTDYGAYSGQVRGYLTILWDSGDVKAFNLSREDAAVLVPWLTSPQHPSYKIFNNLYLSGNDLVQSSFDEDDPGVRKLLEDLAGVTMRTQCAAYSGANCPSEGAPTDLTPCVSLEAMPHARVAGSGSGRAVNHLAQGNGCPELRSFDVLDVLPPMYGSNEPDELYMSPVKVARYASIATDAGETIRHHRIIVDGASVVYRRDEGTACDFSAGGVTAVTERLREVLEHFEVGPGFCTPPPPDDVEGPGPEVPRTLLLEFSPNPFLIGVSGKIRFSMAREGRARIEILDLQGRLVTAIFDGPARQGMNEAVWNGHDATGRAVANGVYFYRLGALDQDLSRKMVVVGRRN